MALIIKGDMPKACAWNDTEGNNYTCFNLDACRIQGPHSYLHRPSDCPILGEIPDEHGELVDRDYIKENRLSLNGAPVVVEATKC